MGVIWVTLELIDWLCKGLPSYLFPLDGGRLRWGCSLSPSMEEGWNGGDSDGMNNAFVTYKASHILGIESEGD